MPIDDYAQLVLDGKQSLESLEADNLISAVHKDPNISTPVKRSLVAKLNLMKNPGLAITSNERNVDIIPGARTTVTGTAAEFGVRIVRNQAKVKSGGVPASLPVPLFLSDFVDNQYQQILPNFLPPGVTLLSVVKTTAGLVFSYTDGVNTDTLTVTANTTSYVSFLQSMNTHWFKTVMIRLRTNSSTAANVNVDAANQFSQNVIPYFSTNFGKFGGNTIPLDNYEPSDQFRQNILEVPETIDISPREGYIVNVIAQANAADTYTLGIAHFVQRFVRSSNG